MLESKNSLQNILDVINDHEKRLLILESQRSKRKVSKDEYEKERKVNGVVDYSKIIKDTKVSEEELKMLIDVDLDLKQIKLLYDFKDAKSEKVIAQNVALVLLYCYKYIFEEKAISGSILKKACADYRVFGTNFGNYMTSISKFIKRSGKSSSPKLTYSLTYPGEVHARALVKQLCSAG